MIGLYPIGVVPINGLVGESVAPPVEVVVGRSAQWRLVVLLGGGDVSHLLSGQVEIDREEGAAAVAEFSLFFPPGVPVPVDVPQREVTLDFVVTTDGVSRVARLFTGAVAEPEWSATDRLMRLTCTDRLQQRVEMLSLAQLKSLIPGVWSDDVFDPAEGRQRWEVAQDLLSTLPASLDCSVMGEIRLTSWYAQAPAYRFGAGSAVHESVQVELAQLRNALNRAEIEVNFRYTQLWQHTERYGWLHPGLHGLIDTPGFCQWRVWSTETPDVPMIESAVESSGQVLVGSPNYQRVLLSNGNPCGDGVPWINTYADLLLGADFQAARRWAQTVTETYRVVLATPAGLEPGGEVVTRDSVSIEVENPLADTWEDSLKTRSGGAVVGGSGVDVPSPNPLGDEARRRAGLSAVMWQARTEIIAAHRETTVSWTVPTPLALGVDLIHTLELADQYTHAVGKCRRVVHRLDHETGEALTDLSIASMQGVAGGDPMAVPAPLDVTLPPLADTPAPPDAGRLPTQIGGRVNHPPNGSGPTGGGPVEPYNDALDGFAGNYDANDDSTAEQFPRRFTISSRAIPELYRDELTREGQTLIRIGIPSDRLEL